MSINLFEEFEKLRRNSSKKMLKEAGEPDATDLGGALFSADEIKTSHRKDGKWVPDDSNVNFEKELDASFAAKENIIFTDASRVRGLVSRIKKWLNNKGLGYCVVSPLDDTDLGGAFSSIDKAKDTIENELSKNNCEVLLIIELNRLTKAEKQAVLSIAKSGKYFCIATADQEGAAGFKNVKA